MISFNQRKSIKMYKQLDNKNCEPYRHRDELCLLFMCHMQVWDWGLVVLMSSLNTFTVAQHTAKARNMIRDGVAFVMFKSLIHQFKASCSKLKSVT